MIDAKIKKIVSVGFYLKPSEMFYHCLNILKNFFSIFISF